jgi:endonuclease-3
MIKKEKAKRIVGELKKLFPKTKTALNYNSEFNLLVAVILSAQTTDKKVNEVSPTLFKDYRTASDYVKLSQKELEKYISSIGLYRGKAKNILKTAKIIHEKYKDKLPRTMEEMVQLPGVGRKTANIVLSIVYGLITGIAVDTHVKRLSNLFGLSTNSSPDKIERDLMEILPKNEWKEFTMRMIDYGRKYCPARCRHTDCPLKEFID